MAKSGGRSGLLYLGANTAVPVAETKSIQANASKDMLDATPQGANFKQYIPDISDYGLKVSKFYDDVYFTMIDAAISGAPLKHYWYPDRTATANYFTGLVYTSLDTLGGGVGDVNMEEHNIQPAGNINFIHT